MWAWPTGLGRVVLCNQSVISRRAQRGGCFGLRGARGRTVIAIAVGLACIGGAPQAAIAFPYNEPSGYRIYDPYYRDSYYREPLLLETAPRRVHRRPDSDRSPDAVTKPQPKPLTGPVLIAVSIAGQHVTIYDNGVAVASAPISSGMKGHATPMGVFSVIQKEKWHRSNLYSDAPMPYMQRITWSGVALHAGVLPGYPASHGCIRMPHEFAIRLWGMTRTGARVVVTRSDVTPFEIVHPHLAALAVTEPRKAPEPPAPEVKTPTPDTTAAVAPPHDAVDTAMTADPHGVVGDDIGFAAPPTASPMRFQHIVAADRTLPLRPALDVLASDPTPLPLPQSKPAERPLRAGAISLFVSRRDGKLYVRKGFEPVFDMPVAIAQPELPLGTHLFTMAQPVAGATTPRWLAVSIGRDRETDAAKAKSRAARNEMARNESMTEPAVEPSPQAAAAAALDRIELPPAAVERIAAFMTPGASLIISDHGLGDETGLETDFIVVTR